MTKDIKMQHSKDCLCDYLLTRLWLDYLSKSSFADLSKEPGQSYLAELKLIRGFIDYTECTFNITQSDLAQFSLATPEQMQKYLKQAFINVHHTDLIY